MAEHMELSKKVYNCLCESIGTEEEVRVRRQYYASVDYFMERTDVTPISSGSRAEGLGIGSDYDAMILLNVIHISEKKTSDSFLIPNNLVMETEDCKPGYAQLRGYSRSYSLLINLFCVPPKSEYRIGSGNVRRWFLKAVNLFTPAEINGPAVSDNRTLDVPIVLRCPEWIQQAQPWKRRQRYWPSPELVSRICSYGILLVPVGCKESLNEHLEWRISFSVAEKHLIYSFTHTQLLCYALMKLVLKEIINKREELKDLLCSYVLKNIMFWVSEESEESVWLPDNLWPCFIKCVKRLIGCIRCKRLPHYFITDNNLFENRFNEIQQLKLIKCLINVCLKGIFSFRNCPKLSNFFSNTFAFSKRSKTEKLCCKMNTMNTLNSSAYLRFAGMGSLLNTNLKCQNTKASADRGRVLILRYFDISSNSFVPSIVFFRFCQHIGKTMDIPMPSGNKKKYEIWKRYLPFLILGTKADSVCGWLYLATYFYRFGQFKTALQLISDASMHCTYDKLFQARYIFHSCNLNETEKAAIQLSLYKDRCAYKRHAIDEMSFYIGSKIVPPEIGIQSTYQAYITPPVYAHFLRFLCLFRLKQDSECIAAIQDMITASEDKHFNPDKYSLSENFNCIATAWIMVGNSYFNKSEKLKEEYRSFYLDGSYNFSISRKLKEEYRSFYFNPNLISFACRLWMIMCS